MDRIIEQRQFGAFRESKPNSGRREATLIRAGWGSSGYYPDEVLAQDGPKAWPAGTHMYLNHATFAEEVERPERDIRDWVGTIATPPRMAGIELVSEVDIFDHWKPVIESIGDQLGLSVVAPAVFEDGAAGGKEGPIIKEIHPHVINSVDYVTVAGAGGKLGTLIESARGAAPKDEVVDVTYEGQVMDYLEEADSNKLQVFISKATDLRRLKETSESNSGSNGKEHDVDELAQVQKQLSEAEDKIRQLESEAEENSTKLTESNQGRDEQKDRADRAEDALLITGAKSIAREAVESIEGLPERAIERIVDSATRGELPKSEDGKLVKETVKETALQKAREELEYLAGEKLEGDLPIRESGTSQTTTTTTTNNGGSEADEEKLVESFQAAGLSEDAAKIAAKGR